MRSPPTCSPRKGRGAASCARSGPRGRRGRSRLRGARAPAEMGATGAVVIWAFDATDSEAEIARLSAEGARLKGAFEALTGLIEAAPLPMWYRGPDLKLSMVNSAYVARGRGRRCRTMSSRAGWNWSKGRGVAGRSPVRRRRATRASRTSAVLPVTIAGAPAIVPPIRRAAADRRGRGLRDRRRGTGAGAGGAPAASRRRSGQCSTGCRPASRSSAPTAASSSATSRFAACSRCAPNGWPTGPTSSACWSGCARPTGCPRCATSPAGRPSGATGSSSGDDAVEETWHLPGGAHIRVVAQPLPDGGLLLIFEDRTEQVQLASARDTLLRVRTATFDNLFEALGRVRCRRAVAAVEQPVPRIVAVRGGVPCRPPARRCAGRGDRAAARQSARDRR